MWWRPANISADREPKAEEIEAGQGAAAPCLPAGTTSYLAQFPDSGLPNLKPGIFGSLKIRCLHGNG